MSDSFPVLNDRWYDTGKKTGGSAQQFLTWPPGSFREDNNVQQKVRRAGTVVPAMQCMVPGDPYSVKALGHAQSFSMVPSQGLPGLLLLQSSIPGLSPGCSTPYQLQDMVKDQLEFLEHLMTGCHRHRHSASSRIAIFSSRMAIFRLLRGTSSVDKLSPASPLICLISQSSSNSLWSRIINWLKALKIDAEKKIIHSFLNSQPFHHTNLYVWVNVEMECFFYLCQLNVPVKL